MIQLRLRTEYSFRQKAYGRIKDVLAVLGPAPAAAVTDSGTWGHVQWVKQCKAAGIRPIFGVELAVCVTADRERQRTDYMAFLAMESVTPLYQLATLANTQAFHGPRLTYDQVNAAEGVVILAGVNPSFDCLQPRSNVILDWQLGVHAIPHARRSFFDRVPTSNNLYPRATDRALYEIHSFRQADLQTGPQHILMAHDFLAAGATEEDLLATERVAAACTASLPVATNIAVERERTLLELCQQGAEYRGIDLTNTTYAARLDRELILIQQKKFEDYFYVIADLVAYAKTQMLVGPGRGSSSGSLVCYLLGITDVDPILHDLMFERFIDLTRADLPDIDLDFQDDKRELVIEYCRQRYGKERVGRIGTVLRYKAKSAIGIVAKNLQVPAWETKEISDSVIDRSTGDARAQFAVADALESMDIGKALVAKYPNMVLAGQLEGHAQTSGTHAAGVIVCNEPVTQYCTIDSTGTAQIDKKDAEALNMLKIDALGLRTLAVLQDALDAIGKSRDWLVTYPLDDVLAFKVFNEEKWNGIFQFEGYALQSLTRQMHVQEFNDIVAITALARPGPLHCGAATEFIERRIGKQPVTFLHPLTEDFTRDTQGVIIYQEQVMTVGRIIGDLSWEDVSELRKAMSKSLGEEFFNRYWVKFEAGALTHGITSQEARAIWEKICTFGSWAFNKSHAVSYGLLSYWCAVLKAHWPLEYAAACLRNAMSDDSSVKVLRDLVKEGYTYQPVDPQRSGISWSVVDGVLLGGLTNIKGIGIAKARQIMTARTAGDPLPPGLRATLATPVTPFDDIFECQRRWGRVYTHPEEFNITSGTPVKIEKIQEAGEYIFIGKLVEKNLRDLNEYSNVVKRGGQLVATHNLFLNMVVEDDTGSIIVRVNRYNFAKEQAWLPRVEPEADYLWNRQPVRWTMGRYLLESAKIGDWFLWKGTIRDDWRLVNVTRYRRME